VGGEGCQSSIEKEFFLVGGKRLRAWKDSRKMLFFRGERSFSPRKKEAGATILKKFSAQKGFFFSSQKRRGVSGSFSLSSAVFSSGEKTCAP